MALYRVYKISPDNHITTLPDVVVFSDDEDVIEYAKKQVNGRASKCGMGRASWSGGSRLTPKGHLSWRPCHQPSSFESGSHGSKLNCRMASALRLAQENLQVRFQIFVARNGHLGRKRQRHQPFVEIEKLLQHARLDWRRGW
jgi:hypothetical protein